MYNEQLSPKAEAIVLHITRNAERMGTSRSLAAIVRQAASEIGMELDRATAREVRNFYRKLVPRKRGDL